MRAFAVLYFLDSVVVARVYNNLMVDNSVGYVVDKRPAYAAAAAGVDKAVLRASVKGILAVDKLGVQHHVALL